jgi:hypothetical protein
VKSFLLGIAMMELEGADVAVVPADTTATAGFRDQDSFDSTAALRDLFRATEPTPVAPTAFVDELHSAVPSAMALNGWLAVSSTASGPSVESSEPIATEPVPDGGRAPIRTLCDLTHGKTLRDQLLKCRAFETSAWSIGSSEFVLPHTPIVARRPDGKSERLFPSNCCARSAGARDVPAD